MTQGEFRVRSIFSKLANAEISNTIVEHICELSVLIANMNIVCFRNCTSAYLARPSFLIFRVSSITRISLIVLATTRLL